MQQLPANGTYAKLIKGMAQAIDGWLFCGADFQALEDKINTLLTKDTNKMAVYLKGYDGHCLRSYSYFKEQMPDIQQANEDEQCFKLTLKDGSELTVKASDTLIYQGKETTAQELLQHAKS